ncbi:hypothetical protein ElP_09650 [Tautonia plasticadhaerens]|uniref:Uncharacterized protein n=1 Tax=Tautonia plasticadhaerens TaxID=2527974 RepID=A0A518GX29_9BACT|nr:hypothetical protein ElP_09650 [Tautonia plasticadhaerens]
MPLRHGCLPVRSPALDGEQSTWATQYCVSRTPSLARPSIAGVRFEGLPKQPRSR